MIQYAIKITVPNSGVETTLFSKPLKSEEHIDKLQKKLILEDTSFARFTNYFTETNKALKIENVFLRILVTIKALFSDLLTWPNNYKTRFLDKIPVYEYLMKKGVNEDYLSLSKNVPKNIYFYEKEDIGGGAARSYYKLTTSMRSKDATLLNIFRHSFKSVVYPGNMPLSDPSLFTRRIVYPFSS